MSEVIVNEILNTVTVEQDAETVVVAQEQIAVVSVGEQGPEGAPGSANVTHPAGAALGGHRVVALNPSGQAVYADSSTSTALRVVGITVGAAAQGDLATMQVGGEMSEPSWSWDLSKALFLGANGQIVQDAPATGACVLLGFPITATSIFISIEPPIILS